MSKRRIVTKKKIDDTNSELKNTQTKRTKCVTEYIITEDEQITDEIGHNKEEVVCAQLLDEAAKTTNHQLHKNDLEFLAETIRQTLLEIAHKREQNNERRHKEKMELLKKHLGTEQRILKQETELSPKKVVEQEEEYVICDDVMSKETIASMKYKIDNREKKQNTFPVRIIEKNVQKDKTNFVMVKPQKPNNEYQVMRQKLLEMQRKKMAEREQKNVRKSLVLS